MENEDLVMTLETIVEKFGDEIAPYAVGLCQNLNVAFMKMIEDDVGPPFDPLAAAWQRAAWCCLAALPGPYPALR